MESIQRKSRVVFRILMIPLVFGVSASRADPGAEKSLEENIIMIDGLLSLEELDESRGKQGVDVIEQLTESDQRAWLEDNQLRSGMTGDNIIDSGALQDIQGIATIIQNTGNQVIIQDSTILNLSITP